MDALEIKEVGSYTDKYGNSVVCRFVSEGSRYMYDTGDQLPGDVKDWKQYDTSQDAWYFGVWVNLRTKQILTYAEGDESLTTCPTLDHFRAELNRMGEFYGPTPPCAQMHEPDGKTTLFYDERPSI